MKLAGAALVSLFALALPAAAGAATGDVIEYSAGITAGAGPLGITSGPDGNLWFTESTGDRIGRITTAGVVNEFPLSAGAAPNGITVGPDGALWFTEPGISRIGRMTTSGALTEYPLPVPYSGAGLTGIAAGPDGNLWATDALGTHIWRTTTGGVMSNPPFSTNASVAVRAIATGTDGALWFPEEPGISASGLLGRITTGGAIAEFLSGNASADASERSAVAVGPDGQLWYTEQAGPRVIQAGAGAFNEFSSGITPNGGTPTEPYGIATGPGGNLWFTERGANQVASITPGGTVTEYATGITAAGGLGQIAAGPDGGLWFTETAGDRIGRVDSGATAASPNAAAAAAIGSFTFTASGVLGTPSAGPACATGHARTWFTFVPSATGFYQASALGSVSPAAVCVFSGSAGALVRETVSEEGAAGTLPTARATAGFAALAGHRYFVLVSGSPATFHLVVRKTAAPPWIPVRMTPLYERLPNGSGQALAWTQQANNAYPYVVVTQPGKPAMAFASAGHYLWSVGFDAGRLLAQRADNNGHSDLVMYDAATRRALKLPKAVNTKRWDFGGEGALSGTHLLVVHGADNEKKQTLAMVDLRKGKSKTIATRKKMTQPALETSSIAGSWIAYFTASNRDLIHRYDIRHRRQTVTNPPLGMYDYASSVLSDGTVYFIRGGAGCGDRIRLMRWRLGRQPEQVAAVPAGWDVDDVDAVQIGTTTWAYVALYACKPAPPAEDILRVPVNVPGIGLVRSHVRPAPARPGAGAKRSLTGRSAGAPAHGRR
jgi:virginiamycin B lyase